MPKLYSACLNILFLFLCLAARAQTVLDPGDIIVLGVYTDQDVCGKPQSDEISFACFKDITSFTTLIITDNGWEAGQPNFWGDKEGVLKLTRAGGTIPRGTVITFRATLNGAVWNYSVVSPDNGWIITNINFPGSIFNLETGGDQVYFMQGGTWTTSNGIDKAAYDGKVLYGYTTNGHWTSDGTTHQSNLWPGIDPCYFMVSNGAEYYKYVNPFSPVSQSDWWHRNQDPANWLALPDCTGYNAQAPNYPAGFTILIADVTVSITCLDCDGCSPFDANIIFHLPPGNYDVVYTDGTNTWTLNNISNLHSVAITILDTTTFSLVSVTEVNGCQLPADFDGAATINVPHNNPGHHKTIFVCPDYGLLPIANFLGPHDPGGLWSPPLDPVNGLYYSSYWGPGTYTYYFKHPGCPADTATITIYWIDPSESTIEIGCDQNGTPNDITDDRATVTLNLMGPGLGPDYWVKITHFGVPTGSVTPGTGLTGVPTTFILDPGTATTTNLAIVVQDLSGWMCIYKFPFVPPGFCSDPCDHNMTATLSGDEDICPNSCPDNPAFIQVDVSGGLPDYTMDFSVSANGFPTTSFTGVPIDPSTQIQVCVGEVAEPYYDAAAHFLVLPKTWTGEEAVITLDNVYDIYGCTAMLDESEIYIVIHKLPVITAPHLTFCKGIANDIDLTEYDIYVSPFYDVTWYDGDPLSGGGDQLNSPTGANLLNVSQLWALITDDYCSNSIQVPLTILPQPDIDSIGPLEICKGDIVVLQSLALHDAGNSMPVYTFHTSLPPDTTNRINALSYIPLDTVTVYILATAGMCYDTIPFVINVQDHADFMLISTPCNLLNHTFDIVFTSSADSIHASAGVVVNNAMGQDSIKNIPENTSVSIEVLNGTGLCKDTFLIVAPNCNCPLINPPVSGQATYSICDDTSIPVMSVTVDPGLVSNWYDVPSGGVALLQNSLTFQPTSAISAIYYAEALDPVNSCFSIRTQIPFEVFPTPQLQMLADQVLCDPETIDLNTLAPSVLNGVNGTGSWFDLTTHLPVSGTIQPQNGDAWYYLFVSAPGSCESRDTIQAIVNPLPDVDAFSITCNDATLTYDIEFTSDADIINTNTGVLTHTTGTDSFQLSDIPYDTDIIFDLTNSVTGCINTVTQLAPDCSCPALLLDDHVHLCTDQGNLDLSTFEGLGVTGSWQIVSTPPGPNPGTLNGHQFVVVNSNTGTYTLRFIRSVILNDCVDTASFEIELQRSPFADAGTDATVCAPDAIMLFGTGSGDHTTILWQENGTGTIANPGALNTNYVPTLADITAGSITFTLTLADQTGFCPDASESIDITIDGRAYFIITPGSQVYCDTADIQVDFDNLISYGTKNGHWFFPDTVSAPITGSSIFNPTTLVAGNYTVFYTTSNAVLPCKNDTVGVNLIIQNCQCPSVALSAPSQGICSESATQELNDFLITTEPGKWTIVSAPAGSKPATISGSKFNTNNSDPGIYRLRFTLNNPVSGCDDFAEISIEVISTPVIQISSVKCAADLLSWEAVITTNAGNVTTSQGNLTSLGNNQYLIDGLTLMSAVQIAASNGNGLCSGTLNIPAPDCACTLSITNLPMDVSLCPEEKTTLNAVVSGAKGNVVSFWIVDNDSLYQNSLEVSSAGTYTFVSIDELGCRQEGQTDVSYYTEMVPDISVVDITCPNDQDGQIILNDITGGNGPYFISINDGTMQPVNTFPFVFSGLKVGNYKIEFLDGFSCMISLNLTVESVSSETLDLGPDQTILVGDSIRIHPLISFVPDEFYWTGDVSLIDTNQLDNWIKPDNDQSLVLYGIDAKGCLYSDDIKIKVLLTSSIYIPTVFSPNDDGTNDLLTPLTDPSVTSIEYFEIFSRWGDMVYEAPQNFVPGQGNVGWDGTFKNKNVLPGVYVYRLSAKNKRGKVIQMAGDITLIR